MPKIDAKIRRRASSVLFISMIYPDFIRRDIGILEREYCIRPFRYKPSHRLAPNLWQQMRLLAWLALRMPGAKAVWIWFADYHAFLPVLFSKIMRKKSVTVLAGYDVTYIPELKYGVFSNPIRSFFAAFAIRNASVLAPVAEALVGKARQHVSGIRGRIVPVPFGFDSTEWYCDTPKQKGVLTVSIADDAARLKIKGVDFLVDVARMLPEVPFTVIGVHERVGALLHAPSNVKFIGRIPRSELRAYYSVAKVYAQLSLSEGMPNVVCEAMLSECIPVGTKIGGIPEIIGDSGYLVSNHALSEAVRAVRSAIRAPRNLGLKARRRVMKRFSEQNRHRALVGIIEGSGIS
jgi:glycosyltransferase involved in cell wall biosynthesis